MRMMITWIHYYFSHPHDERVGAWGWGTLWVYVSCGSVCSLCDVGNWREEIQRQTRLHISSGPLWRTLDMDPKLWRNARLTLVLSFSLDHEVYQWDDFVPSLRLNWGLIPAFSTAISSYMNMWHACYKLIPLTWLYKWKYYIEGRDQRNLHKARALPCPMVSAGDIWYGWFICIETCSDEPSRIAS